MMVEARKRAFGIKRWVRPGDFRASGSGRFSYDPADIDRDCIELAFESAWKLGGSCLAFDFVRTKQGAPVILEVSYGFIKEGYDPCPGYWDADLNWHQGKFNPQEWMVDLVLARLGKVPSGCKTLLFRDRYCRNASMSTVKSGACIGLEDMSMTGTRNQ